MVLLDTNVISELMRQTPDHEVVQWLNQQSRSSIWTTTVNLYEVMSGILAMPDGKRKVARLQSFELVRNSLIQGRIAAFDLAASQKAAELEAAGLKSGQPRDARDTMIAGIALAMGATLATRNERHFQDVAPLVRNPWSRS